jgi:hypothetical protein
MRTLKAIEEIGEADIGQWSPKGCVQIPNREGSQKAKRITRDTKKITNGRFTPVNAF